MRTASQAANTQPPRRCFGCGSTDHIQSRCPYGRKGHDSEGRSRRGGPQQNNGGGYSTSSGSSQTTRSHQAPRDSRDTRGSRDADSHVSSDILAISSTPTTKVPSPVVKVITSFAEQRTCVTLPALVDTGSACCIISLNLLPRGVSAMTTKVTLTSASGHQHPRFDSTLLTHQRP